MDSLKRRLSGLPAVVALIWAVSFGGMGGLGLPGGTLTGAAGPSLAALPLGPLTGAPVDGALQHPPWTNAALAETALPSVAPFEAPAPLTRLAAGTRRSARTHLGSHSRAAVTREPSLRRADRHSRRLRAGFVPNRSTAPPTTR